MGEVEYHDITSNKTEDPVKSNRYIKYSWFIWNIQFFPTDLDLFTYLGKTIQVYSSGKLFLKVMTQFHRTVMGWEEKFQMS